MIHYNLRPEHHGLPLNVQLIILHNMRLQDTAAMALHIILVAANPFSRESGERREEIHVSCPGVAPFSTGSFDAPHSYSNPRFVTHKINEVRSIHRYREWDNEENPTGLSRWIQMAAGASVSISITTTTETVTDAVQTTVNQPGSTTSVLRYNTTLTKALNGSSVTPFGSSSSKPAACSSIPFRNMTSSATSGKPCSTTAIPAAPTPPGIVSGCIQYYVPYSGEYCSEVAQKFGIDVETFMAWNPSVDPPTCPYMLAGYAYCVATCVSTRAALSPSSQSVSASSTSAVLSGPSAPTNTFGTSQALGATTSISLATSVTRSISAAGPLSISPNSEASTDSNTESCGQNVYKSYSGSGSTAEGWPDMSEWVDFDCMFTANSPQMKASCGQWGVADDSTAELASMKQAITSVAASSGIDERFILAIILQESNGCVRVITTHYSVLNPGLMQSHNGNGTCNSNIQGIGIPSINDSPVNVQVPCPDSEIYQMIRDGMEGTSSGDGLVQCMQKQGRTDVSRWYRTARMYNGGSIADSANLNQGCCTASYSSDIANRLTGWTTAPRNFAG